jgi:hypothetical protein
LREFPARTPLEMIDLLLTMQKWSQAVATRGNGFGLGGRRTSFLSPRQTTKGADQLELREAL